MERKPVADVLVQHLRDRRVDLEKRVGRHAEGEVAEPLLDERSALQRDDGAIGAGHGESGEAAVQRRERGGKHLVVERGDAGDFGGNEGQQLLHHIVDFAAHRICELGQRLARVRERPLVGVSHDDENQQLVGALGVAEQQRSPEAEMLAHVVRRIRLGGDEGFDALHDLLHQRRNDDDVTRWEEEREPTRRGR